MQNSVLLDALPSIRQLLVRAAVLATIALGGLVAVGTTSASAVTCPPSSAVNITVTGAASCDQSGNGTLNDSSPNFSSYVFIDDTANNDGYSDGALTVTGIGGTTGNYSVASLSAFDSFILAFQATTPSPKPDWISFALTDLAGVWTLVSGSNTLDHAILYGVTAVPLPATLSLLAAGLGALGFIAWRKKKASPVRA